MIGDNLSIKYLVGSDSFDTTGAGGTTAVDINDYDGGIAFVLIPNPQADGESTCDIKLQDSANNIDFTDLDGGVYSQVVGDGGNDIQIKYYVQSALRQYVRAYYDITITSGYYGLTIVSVAEPKYVNNVGA